jgi:hypothetical protein
MIPPAKPDELLDELDELDKRQGIEPEESRASSPAVSEGVAEKRGDLPFRGDW